MANAETELPKEPLGRVDVADPGVRAHDVIDHGDMRAYLPGNPLAWWRRRRPATLLGEHRDAADVLGRALFAERPDLRSRFTELGPEDRYDYAWLQAAQEAHRRKHPTRYLQADEIFDWRVSVDREMSWLCMALIVDQTQIKLDRLPAMHLVTTLARHATQRQAPAKTGEFAVNAVQPVADSRTARMRCALLARQWQQHQSRAFISPFFHNVPDFFGSYTEPPVEPDAPLSERIVTDREAGDVRLQVARSRTPKQSDHNRDVWRNAIQPNLDLWTPLPLHGARTDADAIANTLLQELPWLHKAIEIVRRELKLRQRFGPGWPRIQPLLLHGPPGGGKTRLAHRLASLLGTGSGQVPAAGTEARSLLGTAAGWASMQPSLPARCMRQTESANPVILVDEIDKATTSSHNGNIWEGLLQMLEPETARRFTDEALMTPIDLSQVSWVLTANDLERLPRALRNRLTVVEAPGPRPQDYDAIRQGLLAEIAEELLTRPEDLPELPPEIDDDLRRQFADKRDIRGLREQLRTALTRLETPSLRN